MWHSTTEGCWLNRPPPRGTGENERLVHLRSDLVNRFNAPPPGPSVVSFPSGPSTLVPSAPPPLATLSLPGDRLCHPSPLVSNLPYPPPVDLSHPPPSGVNVSAPPPSVFSQPPPTQPEDGRTESSGAALGRERNGGDCTRTASKVGQERDLACYTVCDNKDTVYPCTETQMWLSDWFKKSKAAQRLSSTDKKAVPKLAELQAVVSGAEPPAAAATNLARLVRRRRRRRAALKQRRQAARQRLLQRHAEIDAWQADIRRREEKRQQDERVRNEADKVLGEVRRKIVSVETHIQTVELLRTLRETRDLKARQAGQFSSASSDQRFSDVAARLALLLDRHLAVYETELQAMAAMAAPAPVPAVRRSDAPSSAALRVLFGPDGVCETGAGKGEQEHIVHMANWDTRPQALLDIRSAWDRYLVPLDDPLGSGVPPSWVIPTTPSSDVWASALEP